ncbi:hypothetical protein chiPu_0030562, partial [Chiloscyllium punctatum]|nr:hypothetical protein [Chiloscyllium punctatum]
MERERGREYSLFAASECPVYLGSEQEILHRTEGSGTKCLLLRSPQQIPRWAGLPGITKQEADLRTECYSSASASVLETPRER